MKKHFSQSVGLLIITSFMIKYNIPEDVIEDFLIKFDTTMDHRLWTRETIELAKKEILEKYITKENLCQEL